jgi:hypothetical protein
MKYEISLSLSLCLQISSCGSLAAVPLFCVFEAQNERLNNKNSNGNETQEEEGDESFRSSDY